MSNLYIFLRNNRNHPGWDRPALSRLRMDQREALLLSHWRRTHYRFQMGKLAGLGAAAGGLNLAQWGLALTTGATMPWWAVAAAACAIVPLTASLLVAQIDLRQQEKKPKTEGLIAGEPDAPQRSNFGWIAQASLNKRFAKGTLVPASKPA